MNSHNTIPDHDADRLLVSRIRDGQDQAWDQLIARFEGRLLAFARSRLRDKSAAEDVVQEALMGFLVSLPNYDDSLTSLESWLFTITAHKLKDRLRREGRRPVLPLFVPETDGGTAEPAGSARHASSLVRSRERRTVEQSLIGGCLRSLIRGWKERGEFERLTCTELLLVNGVPNKDAAKQLGISEQQVANHKSFVVKKLKDAAKAARIKDFDLAELGLA